jgi:hypothetical protein
MAARGRCRPATLPRPRAHRGRGRRGDAGAAAVGAGAAVHGGEEERRRCGAASRRHSPPQPATARPGRRRARYSRCVHLRAGKRRGRSSGPRRVSHAGPPALPPPERAPPPAARRCVRLDKIGSPARAARRPRAGRWRRCGGPPCRRRARDSPPPQAPSPRASLAMDLQVGSMDERGWCGDHRGAGRAASARRAGHTRSVPPHLPPLASPPRTSLPRGPPTRPPRPRPPPRRAPPCLP